MSQGLVGVLNYFKFKIVISQGNLAILSETVVFWNVYMYDTIACTMFVQQCKALL